MSVSVCCVRSVGVCVSVGVGGMDGQAVQRGTKIISVCRRVGAGSSLIKNIFQSAVKYQGLRLVSVGEPAGQIRTSISEDEQRTHWPLYRTLPAWDRVERRGLMYISSR